MNTPQQFPIAAHSYFHISNKEEARRAFLRSQKSQPVFTYKAEVTAKTIQHRKRLMADTPIAVNNLRLVLAAMAFRKDAEKLHEFRAANERVYGVPNVTYAPALLARMANRVTPDNQKLWQEVVERLEGFPLNAVHELTGPSEDVFTHYREYLRRYLQDITWNDTSLVSLMQQALDKSGLEKKGWQLKLLPGSSHAFTHHRAKKIIMGESYTPRTLNAKDRIVVHEVYGHAVRGPQTSTAEAEGFAVVLEQLMSPEFRFRRSYRYLAVALGWGALGKPMNFRQVFEILWRIMVIGSRYSEKTAKKHAFDECYRAFRGGRPDIAGGVFIKDSIYFDANVRMWDVLSKHKLRYNEFIEIIEGKRVLL